jgi:tRNA(adenine34) deaminase
MRLNFIIFTSFMLKLHITLNAFSNTAINSSRMHHHAEITTNDDVCLCLFRSRQKRIFLDEGYTAFPHDYNNTMIDQYFMDAALRQAQIAWTKNEVPIGAIIVQEKSSDPNATHNRSFRVISEAHNLVETNLDASAHAEILALRQGAQMLQNWRYPPNSTLYSTLEPCPMCLASCQAFRIDKIVYGAPDNRLGAIETHMNLMKVAKHPYHDIKSVVSGVRSKESGSIIRKFFQERRLTKKEKHHNSSAVPETDGDHRRQGKRKRCRLSSIVKSIARMIG